MGISGKRKIMNKLIKQKIYDLTKYLHDNNIKFNNVDISEDFAQLHLEGITILSRSGFYPKYNEYGISENVYATIVKLMREIDQTLNFESSSKWVEKRKLNSLLVKVDKSFTDKTFRCKFERNSSFGGYTETRRKIALFDPQYESISQYLKIVPGINYHELGHVFFTPSFRRLKNVLKDRYMQYDPNSGNYTEKEIDNMVGGMLQVVNMLEDGRIENLMTKKITGSIHYFRNTISQFLLKLIKERVNADDKITEMDCVLISGRKYLDGKVRRWIYEEYEKHEDNTHEKALRVNGYVNKFITLSWQHDKAEMLDLCIGFFLEFLKEDFEKKMEQYEQFSDMIKKALGNMATEMNRMGEESGDGDSELSDEEQDLLKKVLKDLAKEGVEVDGSKGKKKKKKSGKKDENGDKAKVKDKGKGKDGKPEDSDGPTSESKGGGPKDTSPEDRKTTSASEIQEIVEETLKFDADEINKKSNDLESRLKKTNIIHPSNKDFDTHGVDQDMRREERKLEKYFKELKTLCRNGYKTRKRSGTVDIGEARRMEHKRGVKIFRQYKRNVQKALDIDVAFVLDCSWSMGAGINGVSKIHEACKQLWIAMEACKKVGAKVKIFTFSDGDLGTMEQPKNSGNYNVAHYVDSTVISETMYYAENYLDCSESNTKWMISLTDGAIFDLPEHNSIIERMKSNGITCGKINLTTNKWNDDYASMGNQTDMYDHSIYMVHDGCSTSENIVSFFKKIYDISLKRVSKLIG